MAGAVQRNARFAIVVLVNGRHSAGVADCRRILQLRQQTMLRQPSCRPMQCHTGG